MVLNIPMTPSPIFENPLRIKSKLPVKIPLIISHTPENIFARSSTYANTAVKKALTIFIIILNIFLNCGTSFKTPFTRESQAAFMESMKSFIDFLISSISFLLMPMLSKKSPAADSFPPVAK